MNDRPEIVSPAALKSLLSRGNEEVVVVDVRGEADFKRCHLRGAVSNCVYEVAFVERMTILAPGKSIPVCVYGENRETFEGRMAAEKLVRAGYAQVMELREGLAGGIDAGLPVEESAADSAPSVSRPDGRLDLDLGECRLEWTGRNLLGRHRGTLGIKSGHLDFREGTMVGGEVVFDMNAIVCEDLKGDKLHDVLVDHLLSHDFFDTEIYPEALFRIVRADLIGGGGDGLPNMRIEGELSLKDRVGPVVFDAVTGFTGEGRFGAQAVLMLDRTRWNVLYGSGRFFHNLGMHLVNDLIEVELRIVTRNALL